MTDLQALNREFAKYDQVRKAHTYRLAEGEGDAFDDDYEIATLDLGRYPARRRAPTRPRFAARIRRGARGDRLRGPRRPRRRYGAVRRGARSAFSSCSRRRRSPTRCASAPRGTDPSARAISRSRRPAISIPTWSRAGCGAAARSTFRRIARRRSGPRITGRAREYERQLPPAGPGPRSAVQADRTGDVPGPRLRSARL